MRGDKRNNYKKMKKIFNINNTIYSDDILKQAIIDFEDVSEIKYNNEKLEINWENDVEIDEIFNEFMNYVIWLINE